MLNVYKLSPDTRFEIYLFVDTQSTAIDFIMSLKGEEALKAYIDFVYGKLRLPPASQNNYSDNFLNWANKNTINKFPYICYNERKVLDLYTIEDVILHL